MSSKIFEDDSNSDCDIKTDNDFAKNYDKWRQGEELNKLKTKYGDGVIDDLSGNSSSSTSSDDEDGIELNEKNERDFFKTLSYLKSKNPKIYDKKTTFFDNNNLIDEKLNKNKKKKKDKPFYLKDYERKLILEKNGKFIDDEDDENDENDLRCNNNYSPTYVEEQRNLKESLKNALNNDDDDEDDDGILKVREKIENNEDKFEDEHKQWLKGEKDNLNDKKTENELKPLRDYWINPNLDEDEKFLRDYILNKRFLNQDDENYIPTYDEIIHDSDENLSEDEKQISKQEEFEYKYNFRFEEPDQEFIKRYPRTLENSVRRQDDRRKIKRQELKERKKQEKEDKMKDLKKLQEFKRKEIEEKINTLKEITGNTDVGFKIEDIDGDFDPETYDKRMESLFNEDFYKEDELDQKPEFPDLDEEIEQWEKQYNQYDEDDDDAPHCEDDDFNMDCDYNPDEETNEESKSEKKGKKKRKRKSIFNKIAKKPKPVFDPNNTSYEQYLDEYYKFDCEDIIGDIPCKFKYREVIPNDFGLTIEEILMAKEKELNKWCSLKKAVQYRPEHIEKYDQIAYKKKANNLELKRKILPSLFEESETENKSNEENNKIMKKVKLTSTSSTNNLINNEEKIEKFKKQKQSSQLKKKKVRKNSDQKISDTRLSAYGINPKKYKNKLKYKPKT